MRTTTIATTIALVFGLSLSATAGNLVNKDSTKYDLEISCGASTTSTSIGGNTTSMGAVHKNCKVKIKDGASFEVKDDKDVVIKDGKLSAG